MILKGRVVGIALCTLGLATLACAGDDAYERPRASIAPLDLPHATNLVLDYKARRRARRAGNIERYDFLDLTPGLEPLVWPRASDMRARLVTPELRSTPFVGWIAANLYRSRKDQGWCLEVDPGEGEYVVFYRLHLQ